jgi:hypothetical protein
MSKSFKGAKISALTALVAASGLIAQGASAQNNESALIQSVTTDPVAEQSARMAQNQIGVSSVSQLTDVKPTDWAYSALQNLTDKYQCVSGYPDNTFRGRNTLTRFEFAAALSKCLDTFSAQIAGGQGDRISKADLATIQKLQDDFAAELKNLTARVDSIEKKVNTIEAQQFSTTTKLEGEAILSVAGGNDTNTSTNTVANDRTNTQFGYRARLNLRTSFTGNDLLLTRLQSSNLASGATGIDGALASGNSTRLAYDGIGTGGTVNAFDVNRLYYRFPIGDARVYLAAVGATDDIIDPLNPLSSDSQATISRFGRFNPLLRIGTGGAQQSLAGIDFKLPQGNFQVAYSANNAAAANTNPGGAGGLFGGSTLIAAQLIWKPSTDFNLGFGYGNSYHQTNSLNSSLNQETILLANGNPANAPVRANTLVGSLVWNLNKSVTFSTWGSYVFAESVPTAGGSNFAGTTTFTSWMAALSFPNLFAEGNLGGLMFGQPLYRNSVGGGAGTTQATAANTLPVTLATPYHLEAFYRWRVSKNISITPGVYFVFNPDSNSANGTATVGVVRTTFSF